MPTKKISISFSEHYIDIFNYLKTKDNISNYVCQLVKYDIDNKNTINSDLEYKIEELIKKILKENNYSLNGNSSTITSENITTNLTEDDKSLIKDLF